MELENFEKILVFLTILTCSAVKFRFDTKIYHISKIFFVIIKIFSIKILIKCNFMYLFDVFILLKTVSYIKLNFKLKIDPKMCTFKNLGEVRKN